jgi:hypothetical protein
VAVCLQLSLATLLADILFIFYICIFHLSSTVMSRPATIGSVMLSPGKTERQKEAGKEQKEVQYIAIKTYAPFEAST